MTSEEQRLLQSLMVNQQLRVPILHQWHLVKVGTIEVFCSKDEGMNLNCASCWNLLGKRRKKHGKEQQKYLNSLLPNPNLVPLPMPASDTVFQAILQHRILACLCLTHNSQCIFQTGVLRNKPPCLYKSLGSLHAKRSRGILGLIVSPSN